MLHMQHEVVPFGSWCRRAGAGLWKFSQILALFLAGAVLLFASPPAAASTCVFATFKGDAAAQEKLSVYTSTNGLDFILLADTGYGGPTGVLRDPSIMRHTDGKYYVAFTVQSWTTASTNFAIASSADLTNWTLVATVNVGVPGTHFTWAPEWFVEDGVVKIIVNIGPAGDSGFVPYIFTAQNSDLTSWSGPVAMGFGPNYIDTFMVKFKGLYHAFVKNETTKFIEHATASSLTGPWTFVGTGNWAGWGAGIEGPALVQLDDGSWRIYVDSYSTGGGIKTATSSDLNSWSGLSAAGVAGIRHGTVLPVASPPAPAAPARVPEPKVVFDGVKSEHKWTLKELNPDWPADWSDYNYLVLELKASTPQRFSLMVYTANGPRRIVFQPFGQNVWLRASVPLRYFKGHDQSGFDLASTNNRRTPSFWMSVWGPFGDLKGIEALGVTMEYPIGKPTLEIRSLQLAKDDPGSDFLEGKPVLDEFGQWAHADWPHKLKSREQLQQQLADEQKVLPPGHFNYDQYGGYTNARAKATGFFRVEQIDGKWWFVDPDGHMFLSVGSNGLGGRPGAAPQTTNAVGAGRTVRRLNDWGFNTGGQGMNLPYTAYVRPPRAQNLFLGLPDVYADGFARGLDEAATSQCEPRKNDPLLLGYFIGNEPPWEKRESEVVDMILAGPATATQAKAKEFLAVGDTPERRKEFVLAAFEKQLELTGAAIRKHDPNHLNLGIRFGGSPAEEILRTARVFDVCSINVYEYEPTKQVERTYRVTGRPVLLTEFHFGVPADGLGAGLVQTATQVERGKAYRYYVEQAAALPGFVGAHWFMWRDEPVLGRWDGENYNIGLVDVTDRPYPELVTAARATHERLFAVHSGRTPSFAERPKASESGTPPTPWSE